MNEYNPDYVSPPGDTILEAMKYLGMSREEFRNKIGLSNVTLDKFLKGEHPIDLNLAEKLEEILGADARFWVNRYKIYYEAEMEKIEDEKKKRGWLYTLLGLVLVTILGFVSIGYCMFFIKISWTMIKWIWNLW